MLRVVLIDDDADDAALVKDLLKDCRGADFELDCFETAYDGLQALQRRSYDVCLLDYRLGLDDSLPTIPEIKEIDESLPIIILTGLGDRSIDIEAMRAGASDYVSKDHLNANHLDRKIRYAIAREQSRARRREETAEICPRILLVEDDKDDYILVHEMLSDIHGEALSLHWVPSWEEAKNEIAGQRYDICLLDNNLGDHTGMELVQEAVSHGVEIPLILLTGCGDRDTDLEAMRSGASDFIDKNELRPALLDRSIRYAIERRKAERRAAERSLAEGPRIAFIEDDEDDFLLTQDLLVEIYGTTFQLEWIKTWSRALEVVREHNHDVYLVDYRLGEGNGLDLIREAVEQGCNAPIILLTGENSREVDIEAMKAGASDYLVKGEITARLLDRAIRYSIEQHRSESRLTELAQYDQLTGLANRNLFKDFLTGSLARASRRHEMVAVMLIDLDRFKMINDTYGHETGDQLLKVVAERLKDSVRARDLVARLGGDEFTVVLEGIHDPTIVSHFGDRILEIIKQPVCIGSNEVYTTVSIGIAIYPTDVRNFDDLIKSADAAMYRAKESGADNYQFYTVDLHVKAKQRQEIEKGLRKAIEGNELVLEYQPQFGLPDGKVMGFEALLRWQHPSWGRVNPEQFISIAEETGLIVAIGEVVMRQAFSQARKFWDMGLRDFRMAVNLSARQFQELDLSDSVRSILEECEVSPDLIEFEITESSILKDSERVGSVLQEFHDLGLLVALDDFGTGFSSLNHLKNFPGATIKIDQTFVQNVLLNPSDAAIVKAVIEMAHNLGLRVIAEGIETEGQLEFLLEERCDAVQGFFLFRPAASEEFTVERLQEASERVRLRSRRKLAEGEDQAALPDFSRKRAS